MTEWRPPSLGLLRPTAGVSVASGHCRPPPSPWPEHGPSEGHGCPSLGAHVPSPQLFWGPDPVEAPRVRNQPSTSMVTPSHLLRETSPGALTAPLSAPLGFRAGGLLPAVTLSLNSKGPPRNPTNGTAQCHLAAALSPGQLGSWGPPGLCVCWRREPLAQPLLPPWCPRWVRLWPPWESAAVLGVGPGSLLAGPRQPQLRDSASPPPPSRCAACSGKTWGGGNGGKDGRTGSGGPCTPPLAAELWGRCRAWGSVLTGSFAKLWVRTLGPAWNFQGKVPL